MKKKVFLPELQPKGAIRGGLTPIVIEGSGEPIILTESPDGTSTIEPIIKEPITKKPVEEDPIIKEPILEEKEPIKIVKPIKEGSGGTTQIDEDVV